MNFRLSKDRKLCPKIVSAENNTVKTKAKV